MPTIYISGASGFIGRAACAELSGRGVEVVALTRKPRIEVAGARALRTVDYCDFEVGVGAICLHLAGRNVVPEGPAGEQLFGDEIARLTRAILAKGFARVVYASTALVYDDRLPGRRREGDPVRPHSAYGRGKHAAEGSFLSAGHVVARIANAYGRGMADFNVLSHIVGQLDRTGPIRLRNGAPVRDFIHIGDVARALADLALARDTGVFNIGTGAGTSIAELADLVKNIAGQPHRAVVFEQPEQGPSSVVLDPGRIAECCGWRARTALADGVRDLLAEAA